MPFLCLNSSSIDELGKFCHSKVGEGPEEYKAQCRGFMTTLWVGISRARGHQ